MTRLTAELKREIGQHFIFGFHGHEMSEDIKTLIRDYHVGNIILMKRNVRDASQVRKLVLDLQEFAKNCGHERPLMIGTDQENGLVSAFSAPNAGTTFPGAMALASAAASSSQSKIVEEVARASGKELREVGINWTFAPVADINSDMNNPVIGVRSFGDDSQQVASHVQAYSKAISETLVSPCAKHFPGHGDTSIDSHLALPQIPKGLEALTATELVPFKQLIHDSSPVPSIMTGHMALPDLEKELDQSSSDSGAVPASLSRAVTTTLLRERLGFKGVVVTDCLEMDAISQPSKGGCGVEEGSYRALKAGADVVMVCHTFSYHIGSVERVWKAFEDGNLSFEEHTLSLKRIHSFKDQFALSWSTLLPPPTEEEFTVRWTNLKAESNSVSERTYNQSISLISDKSNFIPLSSSLPLRVYTPRMESLNKAVDDAEGILRDGRGNVRNTAGASYIQLAESIRRRLRSEGLDHRIYTPDEPPQQEEWSKLQLGAVVFVLRNAHSAPWQIGELRRVEKLAKTEGIPLVILSSCLPYDLLSAEGGTELREYAAHVACFEYTSNAFEATVKLIFGEPGVRGEGRIPVTSGRV